MTEKTTAAFDDLALTLAQDPDDDVTATANGLLVRGRRFAFLDGEKLAVKVPAARARDLVTRGVADEREEGDGWVSVTDTELWPELAAESHTFVGEPAVGGQS